MITRRLQRHREQVVRTVVVAPPAAIEYPHLDVPMVYADEKKPESIQALQKMIENNTPFAFVKRGDAEDLCIAGRTGETFDGQRYTTPLGIAMKNAFEFLRKHGAYIVSFADYPLPFTMLLHQVGNDMQAAKSFFGAVRNSSHKKVYVGPERLSPLAQVLKAEYITVPLIQAFDRYDEIFGELRSKIVDGGIYMFSAGMPAKVLIADALKFNPNITILDLGSSFDSLCYGSTRWNTATESSQLSQEEMKALYADFK